MPENGSGWQQGTQETARVWTQALSCKRAAAQAAARSEGTLQGSRRLVQGAICLAAQRGGSVQEGMRYSRIARSTRRHSHSGSLPGISLIFVSERVERGQDYQGGRQVCEGSGEQGRGIRMPAIGGMRYVRIPRECVRRSANTIALGE